jgi:hypothetical protein
MGGAFGVIREHDVDKDIEEGLQIVQMVVRKGMRNLSAVEDGNRQV